MTTEEFWAQVHTGALDKCWPWSGSTNAAGYGLAYLSIDGKPKKTHGAHRIAWHFTFGHIPTGMCVCHRCDNPPCCNPAHLFLGTKSDNAFDMHDKGRGRSREKMDRETNNVTVSAAITVSAFTALQSEAKDAGIKIGTLLRQIVEQHIDRLLAEHVEADEMPLQGG